MLTATIGVLGILLGGALNALAGYWLSKRREQREVTAAARVLLPELLGNMQSLEVAITFKRWCDVDFATSRWKDHEPTLAACPDDEWQHVSLVYTAFELLNADRRRRGTRGVIDDPDDIDYMVRAADEARDALALLQRVAGVHDTRHLVLPESLWV